ncbi:hypothetical protein GCM10018773_39120 [Streptomyces candidus]|nr:hypothetical protein GCM10018773_39120 [Streptomyces candidus]
MMTEIVGSTAGELRMGAELEVAFRTGEGVVRGPDEGAPPEYAVPRTRGPRRSARCRFRLRGPSAVPAGDAHGHSNSRTHDPPSRR